MAQTQQAASTDQQLVDRVVYLATLASDSQAIDPILDKLRLITARWQSTIPMQAADRTEVTGLEAELKDYLLHHDPLRAFTEETLGQRLQVQQQAASDRQRVNLLTIVGISLSVTALALVIPFEQFELRLTLAVFLFLTILGVGTAWLYLTALANFKAEFRRAFILLCAGIALLDISLSQYVLLQIFDVGSRQPFRYGGFIWLDSISFGLMYAGLRQYAQLLGLRRQSMSVWLVTGASILLAVALIIAPHPAGVYQGYFGISLASMAAFDILAAAGALLAHDIIKSVTPVYARSMRWLYRYLLLTACAAVPVTIILLLSGQLQGEQLALITALGAIVPQLILLVAGYSFKKETSR